MSVIEPRTGFYLDVGGVLLVHQKDTTHAAFANQPANMLPWARTLVIEVSYSDSADSDYPLRPKPPAEHVRPYGSGL